MDNLNVANRGLEHIGNQSLGQLSPEAIRLVDDAMVIFDHCAIRLDPELPIVAISELQRLNRFKNSKRLRVENAIGFLHRIQVLNECSSTKSGKLTSALFNKQIFPVPGLGLSVEQCREAVLARVRGNAMSEIAQQNDTTVHEMLGRPEPKPKDPPAERETEPAYVPEKFCVFAVRDFKVALSNWGVLEMKQGECCEDPLIARLLLREGCPVSPDEKAIAWDACPKCFRRHEWLSEPKESARSGYRIKREVTLAVPAFHQLMTFKPNHVLTDPIVCREVRKLLGEHNDFEVVREGVDFWECQGCATIFFPRKVES